jgi:hypothetical protein
MYIGGMTIVLFAIPVLKFILIGDVAPPGRDPPPPEIPSCFDPCFRL